MCNEKQPNLPYKQDYVKTSQYFYRKLYHFFSNAGKTGNVRSSRSELFLRKGSENMQQIYRRTPCNFIKKETLAQVFSSGFCEISKSTFSTEHLQMTASVIDRINKQKITIITNESLKDL